MSQALRISKSSIVIPKSLHKAPLPEHVAKIRKLAKRRDGGMIVALSSIFGSCGLAIFNITAHIPADNWLVAVPLIGIPMSIGSTVIAGLAGNKLIDQERINTTQSIEPFREWDEIFTPMQTQISIGVLEKMEDRY